MTAAGVKQLLGNAGRNRYDLESMREANSKVVRMILRQAV